MIMLVRDENMLNMLNTNIYLISSFIIIVLSIHIYIYIHIHIHIHIPYEIDALFPDAIEANKTRMEEVMKKVEGVRGMTSGGNSQDPQTSMEWE